MCIRGNIGAKIKIPKKDIEKHQYLFGEDQSRYLIEVKEKNRKEVSKFLEENGVYYEMIGKTEKDYLDLEKEFKIELTELTKLNSCWFKNYFEEEL